jgi:hypothetical protein
MPSRASRAPTFGTAYIGDLDDRVPALDGDPPRAYPFRILDLHEIVNDTVQGDPLAVASPPSA